MGYFYDKKVLSFIKTEFLPANLQEKVITPQNQTRFITPDVGYSALSKVTLNGLLVDTHQSYTSQTDSTVAYQKTTPTGALKYASLDKVGGMSWKINQLVQKKTISQSQNGITISSNNNGTYTISVDNATGFNQVTLNQAPITLGNKYLVLGNKKLANGIEIYISGNTTPNANDYITTSIYGDENTNLFLYVGTATPNGTYTITPQIFDLTDMGIDTTDVATATSELLKRGININTYNEYNTGSIRDSLVTSVNGTTLTKNDDVEYGYGINENLYNYRDYINNKGHKVVKKVDLEIFNWILSNAGWWYTDELTDGKSSPSSTTNARILVENYNVSGNVTFGENNSINYWQGVGYKRLGVYNGSTTEKPSGYLYYELETEEIEDINAIDNIDVSGGTTTFNNVYHQAVPSEITYLVGVTE